MPNKYHINIIRFSTRDPVYKDALALRENFLRKPLGLSLDDEDLSDEMHQLHFGLLEAKKLVASVTLKNLNDKTIKLRQMIVDEGYQGQGFGSKLIKHVETKLRKMGVEKIEMAARYAAKGFYEKMGYTTVGDIFTEVGTEHIKMVKTL